MLLIPRFQDIKTAKSTAEVEEKKKKKERNGLHCNALSLHIGNFQHHGKLRDSTRKIFCQYEVQQIQVQGFAAGLKQSPLLIQSGRLKD